MDHQLTTLPNGLRVVSTQMPHVQTAAIGVWVDAGARHEDTATHGISHMLEHMAFKGTKRRDARRIAEEIEAVGGHLNAYTSREQTAYFVRILKDDIPLAVDLLADILQNSTFDKTELARERDVIFQEIGQALDTPDDLVFDQMQEAAFPGQPLGRPILGTLDSVGGFTAENLSDYMQAHYHGATMVLSGAGAVDHEALVRLAQTHFGALAQGTPNKPVTAVYRGGDTRQEKKLEQAHLLLGLEGQPYGHRDYYTGQLFTTILGGGMSSRLFQEVREKRGLCYSIYAFSAAYADSGLMGIYAGTGEAGLGDIVAVIADEIAAMATGASADETARGRTQLKAGLMMSLESPAACCEQLARQLMIYDRIIPTGELLSRLDGIDESDIRLFAERLLNQASPTIAALGPISRLASQDEIKARFTRQ